MSNGDGRLARDLLVHLDRRAPTGLRTQLEQQLREGIRGGRLHAGTSLPSTRALAAELGVSRGVVVEAYAQLVAEGWLVAHQGSATRVADVAPADQPSQRPLGEQGTVLRYDLRPQSADRAAFPRKAWLAAVRRATAEAPDAALDYGDPAGSPVLRTVLAAYLGRSRGVVAAPERVVVTSGIMQAVAVLARVLRGRGARRVAVEDPGFPLHRIALAREGLEVVPVEVDERGLRVDALDAARAEAALVTPAHQFPLGPVLAPERRAALLRWAADGRRLVLEDDYDGEYRYDREPVGALQGLAPGSVAYLGSVSKTLAPALRLGWIVLPAELTAAAGEVKAFDDGGCPTLDQLALASLIDRGDLDRHLRRMRLRYRERRDLLVDALARRLPEVELSGIAAGLHVTAQLATGTDLQALLGRAWASGVGVVGFEHAGRQLLVLGYGNLPEPSVEPAVRALARAVRDA